MSYTESERWGRRRPTPILADLYNHRGTSLTNTIMKDETISYFKYAIGEHNFVIIEYFNEDQDNKYYLTEPGYGAITSNASWSDVKEKLDHYHRIFLEQSFADPVEVEMPLTEALKILNK